VGDITYLPTRAGWMYLAVLIDLYSRKAVGWALRSNMETQLCLSSLHQAAVIRRPAPGLIHHSDRRSQYTSDAYQEALGDMGAVASMSRKGNCWDNAVAESFFGTLEQELVGPLTAPWPDEDAVRRALGDYIHGFYNLARRHSANGQVSPTVFEASERPAGRLAA
jgi:putative transposase